MFRLLAPELKLDVSLRRYLGFSQAEIRTAFESAGLKEFSFRAFTEFAKKGKKLEMFIAKGSIV